MKFRPDPESRVKTGAEDVSRHINPATIQEAAELKQMEDAPQRFENPYHLLFEKNLAGVAISVLGEYIVDCNAAWAQIVGYDSPQEVRGLPTDEFYFHPLAEHEPILEVIRRTGSFSSPRTRLRRKDGTPVWVLFNTVLFSAENGGKLALTTAIDVGETKRAEDGLEESEQRFRSVYERSPIGIALVNSRTERFLQVNRKFCEIAGRSEEELLRSDLESITHPDDMELTREKIRQLADLEAAEVVLEKRYVRPDGSVRWVKVVAVPMWGEGEAARWHVGLVEDITERKRAEARLQEYEKVVEGIDDMIVVIDQDYRYVIANQTFLNRRGLKLEQVIGHPASEIVEKKAYETLVKAKIEECFQGRVVVYEMKYGYDKLGERDLHLSYFPVEGPAGVDRLISIMRDVTEQKRAEAKLREYERVVEGLEEMIVVIDRDYRYVIANRAYLSYRGSRKEDVIGHLVPDVVGKEIFEKITKPYVDACFQGKTVEYEMKYNYRTMGERDLHMAYVPVEGPTGIERIASIMQDVTERKRAEEALRQNVLQLQAVTEELRIAKEKLAEEKVYLEESIDNELGYGEIIGRSGALKGVMSKVAKVAPSDASVLLLGETGTGKELVARALHRMSGRANKSFIKMNCAAIPSGLLESELFGHEKGAFTGAVARKIGRLELADGGTLFLDEIGDIPLVLQPKLLRVLQDQEFERLGGNQTLKVNFRLLAATNRDLLQRVKAQEFRSDLYYRLNVFPIVIPPLRERREDIRPLIEHFVRKFAQRMKKNIISIPSQTMEMLVRWRWPGNIRELENFVERSVILTPGSVLQVPLSEMQTSVEEENDPIKSTVPDRDRILQALRDCHGKLGGADGAAARLGLRRTTLQSMLLRMGIQPGRHPRP